MNGMIMHQSIPAVPIPTPPSPGNRGAFAHVVSPGVGLSQILSRPGGWALANPGATPGHLTHVFSKDGWVYRERRGLCQNQSFPPKESNRCINLRGEYCIVFISFTREKTRSVRAAKSGKLFLRAETTELRNWTTRSLRRNRSLQSNVLEWKQNQNLSMSTCTCS